MVTKTVSTPTQWADWLRREAMSSNPEALAALRARRGTIALKQQGIAVSALTPLSFAAADLYIQEREQKRLKILDILKHRRYTNADVGVLAFMGVRHSTGESLALLKRDEVILVMPIDEKTSKRLSRLAIGDPVTCKGMGIVKTRGKSR